MHWLVAIFVSILWLPLFFAVNITIGARGLGLWEFLSIVALVGFDLTLLVGTERRQPHVKRNAVIWFLAIVASFVMMW